MDATAQVSWSQLNNYRAEGFQQFGRILDLPVVNLDQYTRRRLPADAAILDIGCSVSKPFQNYVTEPEQEYFSLDVDPAGEFDFHSFSEIPAGQTFDFMVAHQVIEHTTIPEAQDLLISAREKLAPGGLFLATIPNTAHPVRQWESTHITAWPLHSFYSLFRACGFRVQEMARYGKRQLPWNPVKRWLIKMTCEEFRVDWADSLLLLATPDLEASAHTA